MTQFILVYTHPTEGERRIDLVVGRSYRIGSRPDNDVVVDQKDVSRRHAVLRVEDGAFHITDLDSKNGTFVNGSKIASETFNCGDMVHLSSARMVIVEVGTGSYPSGPEAVLKTDEDSGDSSNETQKYRSEASMEDMITLLEITASAVRRGALAGPLNWAVEHLGFEGAAALYRDEKDSVAMVSSAGDLGELARTSGVLSKLVTDHKLKNAAGTRVRQMSELGEKLLLATVGPDHVLVVRYAGQQPAIGDLRSVIAAVDAVLGSGRVLNPATSTVPTDQFRIAGDAAIESASHRINSADDADGKSGFDAEELVQLDLAAARSFFEEWFIRRALAESEGKQALAAQRLGLSRAGLFKKMRKLGL